MLLTLSEVLGQTPNAAVPADSIAADAITVERGDSGVSPEAAARVVHLARQGIDRLTAVFPGGARRPIKIFVHSDATSLPGKLQEDLHEGTAGLALLGRDQIHVLLDEAVREPPNDLRTVVVHELVHTLLDQHADAGAPFIPRWVHEGLAQTLSGGPYLGIQEENLLFAVGSRTAFRFSELEWGFPRRADLLRLAYAQSYSFVAYMTDRVGAIAVVEAGRRCRADHAFHVGLYEVTESTQARLQEDWENYILFGSGALSRFLLRNCFSLVMILAVPLLVIAVVKRARRNRVRKDQLAAADQAQDSKRLTDEEPAEDQEEQA